MATQIETKVTKQIQTDFMGDKTSEFEYASTNPNIKLTRAQHSLVKEMIDNHLCSQKYLVSWYSVYVCEYFVSIAIKYFPKDAKNTIYCSATKNIHIGKKGAIRKLTTYYGCNAGRDMIPKFRLIARKYAVDPERT